MAAARSRRVSTDKLVLRSNQPTHHERAPSRGKHRRPRSSSPPPGVVAPEVRNGISQQNGWHHEDYMECQQDNRGNQHHDAQLKTGAARLFDRPSHFPPLTTAFATAAPLNGARGSCPNIGNNRCPAPS